jgi:hypothetical protein
MGGLLSPQVSGLLGDYETYEVELPDGSKIRKSIPRGASDQSIRSLFDVDMRKHGIDVGSQKIVRQEPSVPAERPSVRPDGAITEYEPNISERFGWAISDGLRWFGMDGREAARTGNKFTRFLHDWTPLGNADGIFHPESEIDQQISMLPLPGPARRGAKEGAEEVGDAAEALATGLTGRRRASVPAQPEAGKPSSRPYDPSVSYANHSWESAPGKTTGHMEGFGALPDSSKADYHQQAKQVLLTPDGRSRIAEAHGLRTKPSFDNVGYYKGDFSPGTQDRIAVTINPASGKVDALSIAQMDEVSNTHGLVLGQDGRAWNHFTPTDDFAGASAIRFDLGRPMSKEDIDQYGPLIDEVYGGQASMLPDEQGFRVARFTDDDELPSVAEFVERLRAEDANLRNVRIIPGIHSSGYSENDWRSSGRFGADYGRSLINSPIPDVGNRFDATAPQIADSLLDLDPDVALKYGLKTSEDLELLRRTIAEKGWHGFIGLIKEGKLPAIAAPFILGMAGLGGEPSEVHSPSGL